MRRRGVLAALGVASTGGLAGCAGTAPIAGDDGGESDGDSEGSDGGDGTGGSESESEPGEGDLPTDWPSGTYADYEATAVTVRSPEGDELGAVRAAVADTGEKRYLGLSDAPSLPRNAGMLFAYAEPQGSLTYVMREMDFGIDIVYADAEGTIVEIHNAPEPGPDEDGNEQRYPGSGQYVLEVSYEWTDRRDVEVGDSLQFEL